MNADRVKDSMAGVHHEQNQQKATTEDSYHQFRDTLDKEAAHDAYVLDLFENIFATIEPSVKRR